MSSINTASGGSRQGTAANIFRVASGNFLEMYDLWCLVITPTR
jgi:hypothetical protein